MNKNKVFMDHWLLSEIKLVDNFIPLPWKIFLAIELAVECRGAQMELRDNFFKDEYMYYAVVKCYYNVEKILKSLLDNEGRLWYDQMMSNRNL